MIPTIGRLVHYTLDANDAAQINRRRTTGASIAERIKQQLPTLSGGEGVITPVSVPQWPLGAQAHIGNDVKEGDVFPMLIVRTWGDTAEASVNGQVLLDGTDVLWVTSVSVGAGPRTYAWPPRL